MNGFSNITRMRRLRQHPILAEAVRETSLEARQLILPLFVMPGPGVRRPIPSLYGVDHVSRTGPRDYGNRHGGWHKILPALRPPPVRTPGGGGGGGRPARPAGLKDA